jgi:hypothetical protein
MTYEMHVLWHEDEKRKRAKGTYPFRGGVER